MSTRFACNDATVRIASIDVAMRNGSRDMSVRNASTGAFEINTTQRVRASKRSSERARRAFVRIASKDCT
jgi:hypothetical protein